MGCRCVKDNIISHEEINSLDMTDKRKVIFSKQNEYFKISEEKAKAIQEEPEEDNGKKKSKKNKSTESQSFTLNISPNEKSKEENKATISRADSKCKEDSINNDKQNNDSYIKMNPVNDKSMEQKSNNLRSAKPSNKNEFNNPEPPGTNGKVDNEESNNINFEKILVGISDDDEKESQKVLPIQAESNLNGNSNIEDLIKSFQPKKQNEVDSEKRQDNIKQSITFSMSSPLSNPDFYDEYSCILYNKLNEIRTNPRGYIATIEEHKKYIVEEYCQKENKFRLLYHNQVKVALTQGVPAFDRAIQSLEERHPCNPLIYDRKLCIAPPEEEDKGRSKEHFHKLVDQLRRSGLRIDYSFTDRVKIPEISLLLLIVDDIGTKVGIKGSKLLDPSVNSIGISSALYNKKNFVSFFTLSKVYQD